MKEFADPPNICAASCESETIEKKAIRTNRMASCFCTEALCKPQNDWISALVSFFSSSQTRVTVCSKSCSDI